MVHKIKINKMESKHTRLRTDEVEGHSFDLPEVGKSFILFSEPLEEGKDVRTVQTSPVTAVDHSSQIFWTEYSTYRWEVL